MHAQGNYVVESSMFVIRRLKTVKRFVKKLILVGKRRFLSIKYLYFKALRPSEACLQANLLVVKNDTYASIAKICVESFLYFHPNSSVRIHVDAVTKKGVSEKLKKVINNGKVEVNIIKNFDQSWQDSKLELILSLSDPKKFFMDADLKWNGSMPPIKDITLFVNEFIFTKNPFYAPITHAPWFEEYIDASMKNTSFFYWGGYEPKERDETRIETIMKEIEKITLNANNDPAFNSSTQRISEQIALSLLVEKTGRTVRFLKDTDGFKDGSFVESSYFGATGTSF
jgi:hypothetical protein